jgi:hypothetical protein
LWKLPCHEKFHGLKKNEVPVKVAVVPNKFWCAGDAKTDFQVDGFNGVWPRWHIHTKLYWNLSLKLFQERSALEEEGCASEWASSSTTWRGFTFHAAAVKASILHSYELSRCQHPRSTIFLCMFRMLRLKLCDVLQQSGTFRSWSCIILTLLWTLVHFHTYKSSASWAWNNYDVLQPQHTSSQLPYSDWAMYYGLRGQ